MPNLTTDDFRSPSVVGMGAGVYLLAGPAVVALAGIGGYIGEKFTGAIGYWAGCYIAGIVAAIVAGWIFARLFRGHPLDWALGAIGMFLGGHLTWLVVGGRAGENPTSGSDQMVTAITALAGMLLGFAAARSIVNRHAARIAQSHAP